MKVLYVIYAIDYGMGGHFYSLFETISKMRENKEISLVSIGNESSPVFFELKELYSHIEYTSLVGTAYKFLQRVRKEKPDVIHAFDALSFFFARIASYITKTPLILTRCGGPNPVSYYPYSDSIILYSQENKVFFRKKRKYKATKLIMIPNRVSEELLVQDQERIRRLKSLLLPQVPVILRIARISAAYKNSILQSINITNRLNRNGVKVQLLVIGVVQDTEIMDELVQFQSQSITFITEEEFTVNAAQLIDVSDYVVGTGRGFMEAALLGKVMMSPNSSIDIPVLVKPSRVEEMFNSNFSQRYKTSLSTEEAFEEISSVICSKDSGTLAALNLKEYAYENFSSEKVSEKHLASYQALSPAKIMFFDIIMNSLLVLRYSNAYFKKIMDKKVNIFP